MEKTPTAEEFFEQGGTYPELAIKFAKLHVEAALKAANQKAIINVFPTDEEQWEHVPDIITSEDLEDNEGIYLKVDENSILNSYPLDKIK